MGELDAGKTNLQWRKKKKNNPGILASMGLKGKRQQ